MSTRAPLLLACFACLAPSLGALDALAASEEPKAPSPWLAEIRERTHFSANGEAAWAYGVNEPETQKLEFLLEPELEARLPYDLRFTTLLRLRADAFDRIEPGQPDLFSVSDATRRRFWGDHVDFDLRELYVDGQLGRTLFTLGKQQIVWGKADGLKVLDVVNPQSFREFILDDFDDSRTPLWAANVEIPVQDFTFQLLWIPDKSYHDFPEPGSSFDFTSPRIIPRPPPGVLVDLRAPERPNRFFQDSDAGLRISAFLGGWDLTLNYLYHYEDLPIFFTEVVPPPVGGFVPTVIVRPSYMRTHLVGATFSNAFGDFTLRGELGFSSDRFLSNLDASDPNGVTRTREFSYVAGVDWFGLENTLVSVQIFQSVLTDDPEFLLRDRLDTNLTLLARRDFLNETLHIEAIWIVNANDLDGLVQAEIAYDWNDHLTLFAGCDVFYGGSADLFGQFDEADRVVLGVELGF